MPRSSDFVLKDSPPGLIEAAGVDPRGREYDAGLARMAGGVRVEELLLGTKLACVAITDDKEGTLRKVGRANPWHVEALKIITGSEEEAHKPLTHILREHFALQCDVILALSGMSGGHPVDTQGYIAHNDEMIVVAFRCTTSAMDWMTNLGAASSAWEIDEDVEHGHSGWCSCLTDCFKRDPDKPLVHTGFYNNILATVPHLEEYVNPLLAPGMPPRTLYVVGHSLGAGISTMATIYFLEHFPWKELPHRLINISAGTPRSVKKIMGQRVEAQLQELRPLDKAKICRVVVNEDVVAKVPPLTMGYVHVGKLVLLTEDGRVLVGPKQDYEYVIDENELQELRDATPQVEGMVDEGEKIEQEAGVEKAKSDYQSMMERMPRPLREHCPDHYLAPLVKLYENVHGSNEVRSLPVEIEDVETVATTIMTVESGECCVCGPAGPVSWSGQ